MSARHSWGQHDAGAAPSSSRTGFFRRPARPRRSGPYPIATCHFCRTDSYLVPPSPAASADAGAHEYERQKGIYDARISSGNLDAWLCSACQCHNRTDARERGGMSSWEPAMSELKLNAASFARRGTPPLSSTLVQERTQAHPFCHTCLTNQSLLMNMLANYLPDEDDPTYASAFAQLPSYRSSLLSRYPPMCDDCTPAVKEHLARANGLAKQEAMRHFLARGRASGASAHGKGKGKEREGATRQMGEDVISPTVEVVWRLRGLAWTATNGLFLLVPLALCAFPARQQQMLGMLDSSWVSASSVSSLIWTAWNPHWRRVMQLRRRGSDVRIVGQQKWARIHVVLWFVRLGLLAACWMQAPRHHALVAIAGTSAARHVQEHFELMCGLFVAVQVILHIFAARALQVQYGQKIDWQSAAAASAADVGRIPARDSDAQAIEAFSTALNFDPSRGTRAYTNPSVSRSTLPPSTMDPAPRGGLDHLFQRNPVVVDENDEEDDGNDEDLPPGLSRRTDAMDWTPTGPAEEARATTGLGPAAFAPWASTSSSVPSSSPLSNGDWNMLNNGSGSGSGHHEAGSTASNTLGPQRFFVPEQPTGLEDLMLDALKVADNDERGDDEALPVSSHSSGWGGWWSR